MPVSPARSAAFNILLRVERESSYASELLHDGAHAQLSTRDHALATELVMGVERWRSQLDLQIASASSQPLLKLDLEVLIALRLALYQFQYLDRIPQRAAIYDSVELVKHARKKSAAPFVNALLRKLSARMKAASAGESGSSAENLARNFAHPLWLVERWVGEYCLDAACRICEYDQSVPKAAIRLRTPAAEAEVVAERIVLAAGGLLASARRDEAGDVTKTQAFRTGRVVIQDEASQLVAALVGGPTSLAVGSRILDCCAAPGGKTLAIADRNPGANVTATELHSHRARLLKRLLREKSPDARIGVVVADAQSLPVSPAFDRILADVPCSGTGTLARNPEIKWRLRADDLRDLHTRQVAILRSALAQVASRGRVVYSTCSLEREENEDVIEEVLSQDNSFQVVSCAEELERLRAAGELTWVDSRSLCRGRYLRTIPGVHPCDGFFAAILEAP